MKRYIPLTALCVSALMLCSCNFNVSIGDKDAGISVNAEISENTAASEATAAPETTAASATVTTVETSKSAEQTEEAAPPEYIPADGYVEVKIYETEYGKISCPVFNTEKLGGDAEAANKYFASLKDAVFDNLKSYAESEFYEGEFSDPDTITAETDIALNGEILSVMMISLRYDASGSMPLYHALNLNVKTGKAVDPGEVVSAALLTEKEVEDAVSSYALSSLSSVADRELIYDCCKRGDIPQQSLPAAFSSDPVSVALQSLREGSFFSALDEGIEKGELPTEPAVFLSETGQLYVRASVAYGDPGDVFDRMVAVGHSDEQNILLNRRNPYSPLSARGALSPEGAAAAVIGLFDNNGLAEISAAVAAVDFVPDENGLYGGEYVYVVNAVSGEESLGVYGVGVFEPLIWKYGDGEWELAAMGIEFIPSADQGYDETLLGMLMVYPDEYETWLASPAAEFVIDGGEEYVLLGALHDMTNVAVLKGRENADGSFEAEEVLYRTELGRGEWLKLYTDAAQTEPLIAAEFSTGFDKGTVVISTDRDEAAGFGKITYAVGEGSAD